MISLANKVFLVVASAGLCPASGAFLKGTSAKINAPPPALYADIRHVLLESKASESGSDEDEFTTGCLSVSKALVAENDGKKWGVGSQLNVICSGLQLPIHIEICQRFRSTLLGHLHKNPIWNLQEMDFPLFCKGMDKVKAQHDAEIAAMVKAQKKGAPDGDCFKEDAVYGWAPEGSCATAKVVKMFGVGKAVDFAKSLRVKDEDIVTTPIASAFACQAECQKDPDCEYFTYLTPRATAGYGGMCWLTAQVTCTPAYGFTRPFTIGKIAGPRTCPK